MRVHIYDNNLVIITEQKTCFDLTKKVDNMLNHETDHKITVQRQLTQNNSSN